MNESHIPVASEDPYIQTLNEAVGILREEIGANIRRSCPLRKTSIDREGDSLYLHLNFYVCLLHLTPLIGVETFLEKAKNLKGFFESRGLVITNIDLNVDVSYDVISSAAHPVITSRAKFPNISLRISLKRKI